MESELWKNSMNFAERYAEFHEKRMRNEEVHVCGHIAEHNFPADLWAYCRICVRQAIHNAFMDGVKSVVEPEVIRDLYRMF